MTKLEVILSIVLIAENVVLAAFIYLTYLDHQIDKDTNMTTVDLRMDENTEFHKQVKEEVNTALDLLMQKTNSAKNPQQYRIKLQEAKFWFNYHE